MKFDIHFYKTRNLSPDERNALRSNQSGVWLLGPRIEAVSAHAACAAARKQGYTDKLRARAIQPQPLTPQVP